MVINGNVLFNAEALLAGGVVHYHVRREGVKSSQGTWPLIKYTFFKERGRLVPGYADGGRVRDVERRPTTLGTGSCWLFVFSFEIDAQNKIVP